MPFNKGDKNINREGRPKGNSYSLKLSEQITEYCEENLTYFLQEIKSMKNGHAKAQAFISILNYALPKLTESNSIIDINKLSHDDLNRLLNLYFEANEDNI